MKEKRRLKYLITLTFCLGCFFAFSQQKIIDLAINEETSLEEVILRLEGTYGFLFSYKEQDIQGISFRTLPGKGIATIFLDNLLKNKSLDFEIVNENYILLTKKTPAVEQKPAPLFCGTIIDSLTRLPLSFANIYLKSTKKGTSSAEDGSFQFHANIDQGDTLILSYVGYREKRFPATDFIKKGCPSVALNYLDFGEDFVVVTEYLTDGISLGDHGAYIELQPNKIGTLPGQVEPDVLSTIQFLPGVSSTDGTASGISIRGGTPDQNLILWEDIPIYHSAHYFGMISAFNPYIINKVSVYRGGFGAEYGGRISGVIDLKSDADITGKSHFGAGTNFISAYTNGGFSVLNKKLSIVYSLRRSMTELWRSPAFENITKRIHQGILVQNVDLNRLPKGIKIKDEFKFFDSNIKAAYQLSNKDKLSAAWFYGKNDFRDLIHDDMGSQDQADTLSLENQGVSISWNHEWRPGFSTKLLGVHSDYHYQYGYSVITEGENKPDKSGLKNSKITEQQLHFLNTYQTKTRHTFKLAYEWINYDVAFRIRKTSNDNPQSDEGKDKNAGLHVLYGAYSSPKENRLGIDAGLRVTRFGQILDVCIEPRLRLWYDVSENLNLYANGGKYYQFLSQLIQIEGDNSSIETPVWALAGGKEVPVQYATQYQLGLIFHKKDWLLDIQAYTKKVNDLTSLTTGFDEDLSNRYNIGYSTIRGLDILVKKRWKNYQTWISYSLGKIDYHFPTFFDENFAGPNDQRHSFDWANKLAIGNFEYSLGWKMTSGSPYSLLSNYEIRMAAPNSMGPKESIYPVVNEFNSEQLPLQHQLDASVLYNFYPKKKGQWKGVAGISLYNIYHQRNIYSRDFYIKDGRNESAKLKYTDKVNMGFTANFVLRVEW
ncbi:MAG: hypothetical protein ACI8VT_002247 [Saprospiraceae bacterium]|jgi:hypothetical protein